MCGAAKMTCCIAPNGNVYPCAFMQEQIFLAGNVRTSSFKDIWDRAPVFFQLRNLNVESCQTCSRFEVCRGGCPAVAFHTYHDIAMPDPECLVNLKSAA
jgi:radical SAM protein with 4Fe4S-binding SPASM domain